MTLSREKVDLVLAERKMTIADFCKVYSFSRTRFYTVLNSKSISPKTAGRIAEILGVPVSEIIE